MTWPMSSYFLKDMCHRDLNILLQDDLPETQVEPARSAPETVSVVWGGLNQLWFATLTLYLDLWMSEFTKVQLSRYLVCYQRIAKPGNKTAAPSWPGPYHLATLTFYTTLSSYYLEDMCHPDLNILLQDDLPETQVKPARSAPETVSVVWGGLNQLWFATLTLYLDHWMSEFTKVQLSRYLVCYQRIAKPGNKTAAPSWPGPYHLATLTFYTTLSTYYLEDMCHPDLNILLQEDLPETQVEPARSAPETVSVVWGGLNQLWFATLTLYLDHWMSEFTKVQLSRYLVCYQRIAKPGNKTAAPSWPGPYHLATLTFYTTLSTYYLEDMCHPDLNILLQEDLPETQVEPARSAPETVSVVWGGLNQLWFATLTLYLDHWMSDFTKMQLSRYLVLLSKDSKARQ